MATIWVPQPKGPAEAKTYTMSFATAMGDGVTIASAAWTVPSDLTNEASSETSTAATIRLAGGTSGKTYPVQVLVTGSNGQDYDGTLVLRVQE